MPGVESKVREEAWDMPMREVSAVDVIALIRLQMELECIGLDSEGLMVRIPGPDPDEIARFRVAQHAGGYTLHFRHDVPRHVREDLAALPPEVAVQDQERVKAILSAHAPCEDAWVGQSYVFPEILSPSDYPDAVRLTRAHQGLLDAYHPGADAERRRMYAVITAGRIVSTCVSVRENRTAAEAYVFTDPAFRGRGYAGQVTAAWAHGLQREGKVPFYSHKQDNRASQAVARSLGLRRFITFAGYA